MIVERNSRPEDILQGARHVLFVEGSREDALDPVVLGRLADFIDVRPLGASSVIRPVAKAMRREHPTYYFVIDRDHLEAEVVEESWERFLDPEKSNILIWRKREIENYFLDPAFCGKSQFLRCSQEKLAENVRELCAARVYFEAAWITFVDARESAKRWFGSEDILLNKCASEAAALTTLLDAAKLKALSPGPALHFSPEKLTARYDELLQRMTGGKDPIEYGHGTWLSDVKGKHVLPTIVNRCFRVPNFQGPKALAEIAKRLLEMGLSEQPSDFQQLHALLTTRTKR